MMTFVMVEDVQHGDYLVYRGKPHPIVAIHDGIKARTFVIAFKDGGTAPITRSRSEAVVVMRDGLDT